MHVVGCIKTGHARCPIQAMRWTLAEMERGDHVVFENVDDEGNKTWAVGWSDVHYKTCVTTHGSTDDGEPASKKRQREDGRECHVDVKRPKIMQIGAPAKHGMGRQAQPSPPSDAQAGPSVEHQAMPNEDAA